MANCETKDEAARKGIELYLTKYGRCKGLYIPNDKFSYYDAYRFYRKTHCFDEIKYRDFVHDFYPDYMMEVKKLQRLQAIASQYGGKAYYICFFADGWWAVWDVTDLNLNDYKVFKKLLPAETVEEKEKGKKVWKDVIFLKQKDAIKFEKDEAILCKLKEIQ